MHKVEEMRETPVPTLLSVVVPCLNEEANVAPLVERLRGALSDLTDFEIVFVDDGSSDGTFEEVARCRAVDARIKGIRLARNFGHEAASTAGLSFARGDAVVLIDADLQDPPEVIPEMVREWAKGYDVVYACRERRAGESLLKRSTSALFYRVLSALSGVEIPRDTGDFRLMGRRVVDAFLELGERNRFVRGMVAWVGFPSTAIWYHREPRHAGRTKYGWFKLTVLAMDAITAFSATPLRLISLTGLGVTGLSLLAAAVVVYQKLVLGIPIPGYAFLVTGVFLLGGIQILMLGALGEYVGRIFSEAQGRPLFVVRDQLGTGGAADAE